MAEELTTPVSAVSNAEKTVVLPSGKKAIIREGRGRDMMNAQRVLGPGAAADPSAIMFALVAQLATVDGEAILYEDVLEMSLADVIALQGEIADQNFQGAPQPTSPRLLSSDSSRPN